MAIRIRPFLESPHAEIRQIAITLFGHLCVQQAENGGKVSEEFDEQVYKYLFPLLLHLSEDNESIVVAARTAIKRVVHLMENKPKLQELIDSSLLDYGKLNYDLFIWDVMEVVNEEFSWDHLQQAIESVLPLLKSHWPELRGNAIVIVAVLGNYLNTHEDLEKTHEAKHRTLTLNHLSDKVTSVLKDTDQSVRVKAAVAMGHLFRNING